jgi:hypothetical protein
MLIDTHACRSFKQLNINDKIIGFFVFCTSLTIKILQIKKIFHKKLHTCYICNIQVAMFSACRDISCLLMSAIQKYQVLQNLLVGLEVKALHLQNKSLICYSNLFSRNILPFYLFIFYYFYLLLITPYIIFCC